MNGRNIFQQLAQLRRVAGVAGLRHVGADVPELSEVAAALVGGVIVPQELSGQLVVEADHVAFDEGVVAEQQPECVRGHKLDAGQDVVG